MSARQDNRDEQFGREHSGLSLNPDDFGEDWHDADGELLQPLHSKNRLMEGLSCNCMFAHAEKGNRPGAI